MLSLKLGDNDVGDLKLVTILRCLRLFIFSLFPTALSNYTHPVRNKYVANSSELNSAALDFDVVKSTGPDMVTYLEYS